MADRIDHLIKDFVTGRIDSQIKMRRLELSARDHDPIIGTRQHSTIAPQEALLIKLDEDKLLNRLEADKNIMSEWWKILPHDTQKIFKMKYVAGLFAWQMEQELLFSSKTIRQRQKDAKDLLAECFD